MIVSVIRLRDNGRILKRTELPSPVVGILGIEDWAPQAPGKRWRRRATLLGQIYGAVRPDLLLPLFDPEAVKIDAAGMYLMGTEIEPRDGAVFEHIQVWLCLPSREPMSETGPAFGRAET